MKRHIRALIRFIRDEDGLSVYLPLVLFLLAEIAAGTITGR